MPGAGVTSGHFRAVSMYYVSPFVMSNDHFLAIIIRLDVWGVRDVMGGGSLGFYLFIYIYLYISIYVCT